MRRMLPKKRISCSVVDLLLIHCTSTAKGSGNSRPTATKQNKIAFHLMLANSLADVAAEEAAKRLLPDMILERNAKMRSASELVWPNVWRLCKRTSGPNGEKHVISTNLTSC